MRLINILPEYFLKWNHRSNYIISLVILHWRILSFIFLIPLFLPVSIIFTVINAFSTCFFDPHIGQINPGQFGAALTLHRSGDSESSLPLSMCISDSLSASQSYYLLFGLSKSLQQRRQFLVSDSNAFWWTILITFGRMAVDLFDSVHIEYLSLSSREVFCRQCWWHKRFFRQFKCSSTIMWKEWPGCFNDFFGIWNVSYSCNLCMLCAEFLLCSS